MPVQQDDSLPHILKCDVRLAHSHNCSTVKNIKEAMADISKDRSRCRKNFSVRQTKIWELTKTIWQDKRVCDFEKSLHPVARLRQFGLSLPTQHTITPIGTTIATKPKLDVDLSGEPVDQSDYRSKIRPLLYLTSSRPELVQAVCYCARYQARPTQKHLNEVKRIFKYLKGTINMVLWYPKDYGFEITAFLDADHAGCIDIGKSTSRGIQFLGDKLRNLECQRNKTTLACLHSIGRSIVALSASCAQVMWMRTQLKDYGFNYNKRTVEQVENGIIELYFVRTEYQLADMFTKALPEDQFKYLVRRICMRCLTPAKLEVLANETA
ncbi:hypothetical protein Tco_0810126 [Tanacetum coccineum]